MTWIFLSVLTLVLLAEVKVKGISTGSVICNNDHTATITIVNVTDINAFNVSDWRIDNKEECEPTFANTTVTYANLPVATCASTSEDKNTSIRYVFQIRAVPPGSGPIQAFDHIHDASCEYVNNGTTTASFIPIVNRGDNSSDTAFFIFTLGVFEDDKFGNPINSEVELDKPLYFRALVVTSSSAPNLDLFIVKCHASQSNDPDTPNNDVVLIENGCGNNTVSEDQGDTLSYTCAVDSKQESFQVNSFRYFGAEANAMVYVHCEFKVCLADSQGSACECPSSVVCDPNARKRRSVDESLVYRVTTGPYHYKEEQIDNDNDLHDKTMTGSDDKPQFYLNLTIILAVGGVVIATAICVITWFLLRKRQQRSTITKPNKSNDHNIKT